MYHRFYFGKTEIFFLLGLDKAETHAVTDLPVGQNQLGFPSSFRDAPSVGNCRPEAQARNP
jgi:hypothetical protein